jgi:adenylyl-sulfate kinase
MRSWPPGMVLNAMQHQVFWQDVTVGRAQRAQRLRQKPLTVWFTGLSGAGKTTLANAVESALQAQGYVTYLLDGDNIRHGLCSDLGFSELDRAENIRRVGEVACLMVDAGLIVLASFISPSKRERDAVRQRFAPGDFVEVYVSTPLAVCEQRDTKGLYKLAHSGKLAQFTGVSAPYEIPLESDLVVDTSGRTLGDCACQVTQLILERQ